MFPGLAVAEIFEVHVPDSRFSHSIETLSQITRDILSQSKLAGATACEAEVSQGFGQNVSVRRGEVETIEYNRDKGLGVTVYFGDKRGHASTSDLSPQAIKDTVAAAVSIARYTASDEFAGLADENLLAREIPDLSLYHPWDLSVEQAIEQAKTCEAAAFAVDKRIDNSEGASVSTQESLFMYGNSLGFLAGYPSSRHDISCAVIAEDDGGMQRDYWYSSRRDATDLETAAVVGRKAGERTVRRLAARKIKTTECPVLFEAPIASGLIGHLVGAVSGGSLYRKSSFLLDSLGQQVFAPFVQIRELPHILKGLASSPFDNEGVATRERDLIKDGVLQGYFLGSYSARKLGMTSTGNAGGNHNLIIESSGQDFEGLLKMMGKGLVVTELLGHGINPVTGDYSRGAAGYWVENGEIQYPVEEITIAGNLKDMFKQITAVGSDILVQGSKQCGSVLIERMTVAGD
ncbi:peptidase U62, modulator of DNA gyrase [Sulfuricella denitrificans skB26]|uniref:Peptidase U62, modulator of DNA gyrase n=1 Tax=Sulfuricella denitrificans (strain DSM 22764 / NBRC 105220 / skB26) TaxID=1163617 RepID=S6B1Y6_SULDS|nr:peptidase U62, modulator of DNA gyrase [Sulfuricella denitrificans skB26]